MKLFPMPFHSLLLFVVWLLLNNSISAGHMVLAVFFAITIPLLVNSMRDEHPKILKPWLAIRYILMVLKDILTANVEVALLIIGPIKKLTPGFVAIPINIDSDLGITILASTVSLTPGTVSAEVSKDKAWLYVHSLHLDDEAELIKSVKQRYEKPIKEIFGC
ncbi:MAG: Na+/H+ antiporter subunit E [Gammaproteobacteria bacterium]|jgi:multicomponent K+:H+ antiporter subunit E|uniref:Multisubunit potassium/proton antiporter, PhaE subunit n=1 Tax=Marinomonas polaris DSM 16579 TaxID=1122206 RepID=A0A1M5N7G7_9GAMM|nr:MULTISPECIES: Na+/H+ antiporter subunit E [Marinomonas]MBU1294117.1 Na+/H+ antiporter subunit E [Gammaproteobacteria bacterium]MBU1467458.1 Na+/H+ antiporter subunit E [Gammaproteobacteria bacterium]MBU2025001.1 Na+/H+ antiporter subunit E [Gammaproteobacteria bacterium]MBU2237498.1 Na+/H+ antiporter subunit E [Gammaproteobacteria bacterium]MBU2320766.1 Na+/H+ antiporter subunit E [Gammaproteobacteria bacterium]|tara:strand:+ start:8144 stop:8629 length:486 start_codon:yes stop_codon:yes gene_type:complete